MAALRRRRSPALSRVCRWSCHTWARKRVCACLFLICRVRLLEARPRLLTWSRAISWKAENRSHVPSLPKRASTMRSRPPPSSSRAQKSFHPDILLLGLCMAKVTAIASTGVPGSSWRRIHRVVTISTDNSTHLTFMSHFRGKLAMPGPQRSSRPRVRSGQSMLLVLKGCRSQLPSV